MLAAVFAYPIWTLVEVTNPAPEPAPIVGGNVAQSCQWPATVSVSGCSATLVHPQIILYAAHCGSASSVRFGESSSSPAFTASVQYCRDSPQYPATGTDYAYCKLNNPVTNVPVTPILMGCEVHKLTVGTRVTVVGFGQTSGAGGGAGTKRWIEGSIGGFPSDGKMIGIFYDDLESGACFGDSGGSAYVELEDGGWRVFGITSTIAGACAASSQHVPMWNAVEWVEQDSGIDITPCHDVDGAWNPSAACMQAPLAPGQGGGVSWADGCSGGPTTGPLATCGPKFGDPPDVMGPRITIVTPRDGSKFAGPTHKTPIELTVGDDWGLLDVRITIDGEQQALLEAAPWVVPSVAFPQGTWEIGASGRDWSGNMTQATPVVIEVGSADETGGDDTTSGGEGTSETTATTDADDAGDAGDVGSEEGSTGPAETGDSDGCGCRVPSGRWDAGWLMILGGGLAWPRSRRLPCRPR